jgi:hypothetical protein
MPEVVEVEEPEMEGGREPNPKRDKWLLLEVDAVEDEDDHELSDRREEKRDLLESSMPSLCIPLLVAATQCVYVYRRLTRLATPGGTSRDPEACARGPRSGPRTANGSGGRVGARKV